MEMLGKETEGNDRKLGVTISRRVLAMIDDWSDGTVLGDDERSGYWSERAGTAWGTDTGTWREGPHWLRTP